MKYKFPLFLLLLFSISFVYAQEKEFAGTVVDTDGVPIPGVNITIEGTSSGTASDFDGNFTIMANEGDKLLFSSVGFDDYYQELSGETTLKIVMKAGQALEEVVVVGYGTQKARDVSTAISNVKSEDFNQGLISNPMEQIQGKVPGLVVTSAGGDPNNSATIRLRGQASLTGGQDPLIVLNGVPLDNSEIIDNIPAEDIETYDVLKDQSATAVYGSRGANGVIMITTKKGSFNKKTNINYSSSFSISNIAKKPDMLNAAEWKEASLGIGASEETINSLDHGADTDWMDAITRTAYTHNHHVGISGGSKDFSFYGSVNYRNQEGIVIHTGKEQIGVNFYSEKKAFDDKLKITLGIINTDRKQELVDEGIFGPTMYNLPTFPVFNEDGTYNDFSDTGRFNPVQHQEEQLNRGRESYRVVYGGADYSFDDLIEGLSAGVFGSISKNNRQTLWFKPVYPSDGALNEARQDNTNRNSNKGDIHINYNKDWGEHHLDASLVHEYSDFIEDSFLARGKDFMVEDNMAYALQNGDSQFNEINSVKQRFSLSSFLARFSYNFSHKYYFNVSYRRDGSSKFGRNNRWGNFPAFSLAWRLSNEKFLSDINWINELKLRGGYGVTGNQDAIDPYRTRRLYGSLGRFYDAANDSYPLAYGPTQNENPDLRWEEIHGVNIGLDFAFLEHKITGNLNWFQNKTKNLLFTYKVPVPPFEVDDILANVGSMMNKGVEVQVNANIMDRKDFSWSINGQITFIDTKIESLSGSFAGNTISTNNVESGHLNGRGISGLPASYLREGAAPYTFYLAHSLGLNEDGEQIYSDGEGGTVEGSSDLKREMYEYHDPTPDFTYGFGSRLNYKNWSLNAFFRGVVGQKIYNNTRLNINNLNRLPGNNTTREALASGINSTALASDRFLESGTFLRLDNLTLSYSFTQIELFDSLNLFVSGNNLFVITPYKGLDPEIRTSGDNAYIDKSYGGEGFYPKSRSFTFGVNVSF